MSIAGKLTDHEAATIRACLDAGGNVQVTMGRMKCAGRPNAVRTTTVNKLIRRGLLERQGVLVAAGEFDDKVAKGSWFWHCDLDKLTRWEETIHPTAAGCVAVMAHEGGN